MEWAVPGSKQFETGVSKGVLYPQTSEGTYGKGVPWIGLQKVSENPTGGDTNKLYADNSIYAQLVANEEFEGSLDCYMYPLEFEECDGSKELAPGVNMGQQTRLPFGLCYRTEIGNDANPNAGYKIHLVYGATASPSSKDYETVNDNPDAITFSFDIKTTPVQVTAIPDAKPTSTLTINSTKVNADKLKEFEKIIYGDGDTEARLPLPDEIYTLFKAA